MAVHNKLKGRATNRVGNKMPDGTVYAGISPKTHKPMYTTRKDAPLTYTFYRAQNYAGKLGACGHRDWQAPTKDELNVLFQNRAAIGGFNNSGSFPVGWYRSSSRHDNDTSWAQDFSDGDQDNYFTLAVSALRCVRG
jgi:hypothetical protein